MDAPSSQSVAIQVKGLTKEFRTYKKEPGFMGAVKGLFHRQYETVYAVKDIDFEVNRGEFIGFLGPNGAGKTTTLKMLSGLLHPTGGSASVLGYNPWLREDAYRRQFALLLGQKNQLWWDLPARESLELNSRIYGLTRKAYHRTVDELSEMLKVDHKLDVMVRELSLGERMKMELIAALLHHPKILFLDEPTIGLDVVSQKIVREFLKEYNRKTQTTVLLTSHYMSDIEYLCQRVVIIHRGKIFFDGQLDEVIDRFADYKIVTIQFEGRGTMLLPRFTQHGELLERSSSSIRLKVRRNKVIPACKAMLDQLPVTDIDIQEVSVDDVIRNIFDRGTEHTRHIAA